MAEMIFKKGIGEESEMRPPPESRLVWLQTWLAFPETDVQVETLALPFTVYKMETNSLLGTSLNVPALIKRNTFLLRVPELVYVMTGVFHMLTVAN